jgi:hypothetical protein
MIEYLLLLTLTVALVLAVSRGVGEPLQKYLKNNVLDMVGCMLRVGQFPAKSFGLCQNAIKIKMDAQAGQGGGGSGSGGTGNSSSSSNDENSAGSEDGDSNGNGSGPEGDSDGDDSSNRARVRSNNSAGGLNDSGDDSAFGNGPTTRIKITNDDSAGEDKEIATGGGNNQFGETTIIVRRIKREDGRVGGSFMVTGEQSAGADPEGPETYQSVSSQVNPRSEFDREPSGQKFSIPKPKDINAGAISKSEDVDFSFLGMIKWIIIIGVLFFILVFAASQLNSIRKGWTD